MSVLSDRDIRAELEAGHVRIDPYDARDLQPSSVDLHLDRSFRVFRNNRYAYIDVRDPQPDLTELLHIEDDEAFILHPGEFVLGQTLEWVELPVDLVARLEGKALALDTPVPTPGGWRTMGDLEPGDFVFDETGAPVEIVGVTPPMLDRPCRGVTFSDGTYVVADADHQWVTVDKNGRRYGRARVEVRTTDQIARTLTYGNEFNHHVPLADRVQFPDGLGLPIEPYTLGVWLGDGTTTNAEVTSWDDEILALVSGDGYEVRRLEAGSSQRLALLQGLMDTDGFVDDIAGRCEFTSVNEDLADGIVELAASLGFRPVKSVGRATLDGVDKGPKFRVKFTPDRPVFRLTRKLARQRSATASYQRFRAITHVEDVPPVPVRCIQVGSPRGVFLVSKSFIPTHNSSLGRLGLLIHSTAGYVDPGWKGNLTLELSNVANLPIALYYGMRIGQISFFRMSSPVERPYGSAGLGSKYQGQSEPTASAFHADFASGRKIRPNPPR